MSVLLYEVKDRIAYITMNRPEKLNAMNKEMLRELYSAYLDVKRNPDVWAAIITGTGRAFSTGHDMASLGDYGPEDVKLDELYVFISQIWKPIIAAVNGLCMAQGAGLALLADIRIAAENAQFRWPQAKSGITSVSGPSLLAQRVPLGIALEYLFTAEPIMMAEAQKWGIVNRVVAAEELMPTAEAMARKILANAPLAVRTMKEASIRSLDLPFHQRVSLANLMGHHLSATSTDTKEGVTAFLEKRPPVWRAE